jgi:hypothetical protein
MYIRKILNVEAIDDKYLEKKTFGSFSNVLSDLCFFIKISNLYKFLDFNLKKNIKSFKIRLCQYICVTQILILASEF